MYIHVRNINKYMFKIFLDVGDTNQHPGIQVPDTGKNNERCSVLINFII